MINEYAVSRFLPDYGMKRACNSIVATAKGHYGESKRKLCNKFHLLATVYMYACSCQITTSQSNQPSENVGYFLVPLVWEKEIRTF